VQEFGDTAGIVDGNFGSWCPVIIEKDTIGDCLKLAEV